MNSELLGGEDSVYECGDLAARIRSIDREENPGSRIMRGSDQAVIIVAGTDLK